MATKELLVLMNGRLLGQVVQKGNKLSLSYDDGWIGAPDAFPMSMSMPLTEKIHKDPAVPAFLWSLLPDNDVTLSEWGRRYQVSRGSAFALLGAVGEDCPGAVQFVTEEKLNALQTRTNIAWLDEQSFNDLLIGLTINAGAGRLSAAGGQFSLAGAQPKTALLRQGKRWGIPGGRTPTTHILKPATGDHEGIVENEHFCLRLAARLGLIAARSSVIMANDLPVICVERYDRQPNKANEIVRLHQEDLCQSLGVHPRDKYEKDGGPGIAKIMAAIKKFSSNADLDRDRFMRASVLNYIILGTDAHAKNYGFLILPYGKVGLAPLYDIISYLPYAEAEKGIKLAMRIGRKYKADEMMPRHWEELCREIDYPPERFFGTIRDQLARLPGEALGILYECRKDGLKSPTLDKLIDALWSRVKALSRLFGTEPLPR